ncbi:MAG: nucleotidyltransferase domain-containing protein [Candidatus Micrarchaeota archaeon]
MLEMLFGAKARVKVLAVILERDGLHLREIARVAGVSSYEAKRELDNFYAAGIVKKERKGNLLLFYQDKNCPFLHDLKQLYRKTEGALIELKKVLEQVKDIEYAFVFGSMAKDKERQGSDIDLLVIGEVNMTEMEEKMLEAQKRISREINFIVWKPEELFKKSKEKNTFLRNLVENKRSWLVGDEDEFVRIAKERDDRKG